MTIYTNRTLVALKKETTYGTDADPAGSNCFVVKSTELTPMAGNSASRDIIRAFFGASEQIQIDAYAQVTFEVELQSSGAAGTAPAFSEALLCAGFAETVTASTSVAYSPVSTGFDSCTIAYNKDGVLQKLTGARGTFSLNLARGALPSISFTFWGIYNAPTDTALLTPDYSGFKKPIGANSVNTPTVSLLSQAVTMESLSIDLANNLVHRDLPGGSSSIHLTQRAASGSMVFEATSVATKNWVNLVRTNASSGALQVIHGIDAGYICQIDAPNVSLGAPTYSSSDGIEMLNAPLTFNPLSGNDELVLTFK